MRNAVSESVAPSASPASGELRVDIHTVGEHRRVGREVRLAHEAVRGGDQFQQVLDTILAVLLRLVVREQAGLLDHVLDRFRKRQRLGFVDAAPRSA